jgi:hypothetical protein
MMRWARREHEQGQNNGVTGKGPELPPAPDVQPVLGVYVVWHPGSEQGAELAGTLFKALCANPEVPARRGLGVPVRFRTAASSSGVPAPIPFGSAAHTVVFVLCDDALVADRGWHDYLIEVAAGIGGADRLIPVTLTAPGNLPSALAPLQEIGRAHV